MNLKISFEDGSFISLDESVRLDKLLTLSMCGLKDNGKSVTMSTSELTRDQVIKLVYFLSQALENME